MARVSAVGAWAVLSVAIVWAFGLGGGTRQPLTTLDTLGRIGIGLLWLRVAALWAAKAARMWHRRRRRRVSLSKDLAPLRFRVPMTFDATPWVWVRVAAVLLLLFLGVFFVCFVVPISVAAEADQLHDLAWRPLAQTALPVLATLLFLWIRPLLTGVGVGGPESILPAVYGGFAIPLLFLYIGLALRALVD
ncbi:hypothetical protein OG196_41000 [Kitasatospora purpeofusca]|uniref:hypothetical protein n=1 Tax=Kitasatospora purpeofusca TaxID=67352 RepID=UPI002E118B51|nr:hypothetical protein OG196_41000 [Kitasatospora purpeofusca]